MEHIILDNICTNFNETSLNDSVSISKNNKWSNIHSFLSNISQSCSEMIESCQYASRILNCSEVFQEILTDDGICCSFNILAPKYMYKK